MKYKFSFFSVLLSLLLLLSGQTAWATNYYNISATVPDLNTLNATQWTTSDCSATTAASVAVATLSNTTGDTYFLCDTSTVGVDADKTIVVGGAVGITGTIAIVGTLSSDAKITLGGATTLTGNLTMTSDTLDFASKALTLPAGKTLRFDGASAVANPAAAHVLLGNLYYNSTVAMDLSTVTTTVIGGSVTSFDPGAGTAAALTLPTVLTTIGGDLMVKETAVVLPGTLTTIGGKLTTGVNQTIGASVTSIGSIDVTGGTLLLADSAPNTRTISGDVKTATALVTRVTDIIYGNLEIAAAVQITGPTKLSDGNHTVAFPVAAAATYSSLDLSSLTSGKVITIAGAAAANANTISAITYPSASGSSKTFEIANPTTGGVVFTAALTNCIDKSTAAPAAAPAAITSPLATGKTVLCTVAASSVAAPIFSTQEKGKVFVDEVK